MNSILKYEIRSDIRDIIAEIEYEEYMFNKVFKTHVTFKNSYKKFNLIYDVYGPQAYRKFVPSSYQKQDLLNLINSQNYLILYDRHGKKVFNNLVYTVTLSNFDKYYSKFRTFLYRFCHLFTRKRLKLNGDIPLLLPEKIPTLQNDWEEK
ncbi:MAG: hypothetical protein J6A89_06310 [Clostridia bacterium]|nr:hypothetical protein [Clostridia bacterium]